MKLMLSYAVPTDEEAREALSRIVAKAKASLDAEGKPYPPQLRAVMDQLAGDTDHTGRA